MNGINNIEINEVQFPDGSTITSANNLVQLDTNNNFTSFNTYNTNLPTSDVNPDLGVITNNTILNKHAADKLYIGNDEISECFDGASISGRDITLTRVDNANPKVIEIPETSLSTCVLLTGTQEIDGEKTFVDFPKIKVPTGGTLPTPTDNAELATKKYVDDNGGGSTPTNMATTNTTQTITGNTTDSNGDIIVKNFGSQYRESTDPDRITHFYDQIEIGGSIRQNSVYNGGKLYINGGGSEINMPSAASTIRLGSGGKIGISNNSSQMPTFPLHIRTSNLGASNTTIFTYFRHYTSTIGRAAGWGNDPFSIFTSGVIMSATFTGASDVRIKKDIMDISSGLQLIEQIKPRTYKYRDPKRGDKMAYGFIAQELEEVIPELIQTTKNTIPNIMKTADVIDGVFILKEATDLQVGDEIDIYDEDDNEYKVNITEIINDKSFKTDIDVDVKDKYFIYGKYVDDFKGIEHNGLLPIMLKSIQELNARVKELEAKINNM
tara:strand:+ start:369 stop:1850 length:1482 start_codon:yes stop_codon:yes gene_type:complete